MPEGGRGFGAYLRWVRRKPAFKWQLAAAICYCSADIVDKSLAFIGIGAAVIAGIVMLGYLLWLVYPGTH